MIYLVPILDQFYLQNYLIYRQLMDYPIDYLICHAKVANNFSYFITVKNIYELL